MRITTRRQLPAVAAGLVVAAGLLATGPAPAQAAAGSGAAERPAAAAAQERASVAKTFPNVLAGRARLMPGDRGPVVRQVQLRLRAAGIPVNLNGRYDSSTFDAVIKLQDKFLLIPVGNVNSSTLRTLLRITDTGTAMPKSCRTPAYALCVSKTQRVMRVVRDGKVVKTFDARFGASGMRTRNGTHKIVRKVRNDYSYAYNARMPYSMYFYRGQAVHYSDGFAADGYSGASHGCVNIRDWRGIAQLFNTTPLGTPVVIYGADHG